MTPRIPTIFGFLVLILPFVTAGHWSRRHQEVAHRARGDVDIHKRQSFTGARFTFYDVGLGACGQYNVASDWIVALNVEQYGGGYPGPMCFQSITIQYGGKTAQATIMDECMGCPWAGLDFSRGLFDYFADESVGVIYGTWWFNGGSGGGGDQTTSSQWTSTSTWDPPTTTSTPDYTPPPPTTSSTPDYTPPPTTSNTPDYTPPPTTSSTPAYTPPPTSSSTSTFSITSSSISTAPTSVNFSTGSLSGLGIPTGGLVPAPNTSDPQNLLVINDILVEIGIALSMEKTE